MIRAAAGGATLFLAGIAAAHFMFPRSEAPEGVAAQFTALNQRLDSLQRSVEALAATRPEHIAPAAATAAAAAQQPAPTAPIPDVAALQARDEALRAGNAVVDRALQSARWTIDDVARLATVTATLNAQDRAELKARLSAAINQDRLQVDPDAMAF